MSKQFSMDGKTFSVRPLTDSELRQRRAAKADRVFQASYAALAVAERNYQLAKQELNQAFSQLTHEEYQAMRPLPRGKDTPASLKEK